MLKRAVLACQGCRTRSRPARNACALSRICVSYARGKALVFFLFTELAPCNDCSVGTSRYSPGNERHRPFSTPLSGGDTYLPPSRSEAGLACFPIDSVRCSVTPAVMKVLAGAGYVSEEGAPAEGLATAESLRTMGDGARLEPLFVTEGGLLGADAVFRVGTSPVIVFKSSPTSVDLQQEQEWHRVAWNFGAAPLLWVTSPQYVRIYNAYQPPEEYKSGSPLLATFPLGHGIEQALTAIEKACGRRTVATGAFWNSELARPIDRQSRIDNVLLSELTELLWKLKQRGIRPSLAQKLVGRCVFFQYLAHRGYLSSSEMAERFGAPTLHEILTDIDRTFQVFRWIRTTFNGDLFPIEDETSERQQIARASRPLNALSDFFGHFDVSGQGRLFPFRFDVIPIELISSIYEKFVHLAETDGEPILGVHYTPINLVDLLLDPVFDGLSPTARVLDPACGSGVFLVESLRRLVWLRGQTESLTRELVRDVLMTQIRGVDISPAALSVAAFSLYLALLELDPEPPHGIDALNCLRFDPLHNQVLFATSVFDPGLAAQLAQTDPEQRANFDVIIGNPPWTYSPSDRQRDRALISGDDTPPQSELDFEIRAGDSVFTRSREGAIYGEDPRQRSGVTYCRLLGLPTPRRSPDWPFLWRCRDFANAQTRIALIMKATPFFSLDPATSQARQHVFRSFPNFGLVNLSQLRTARLFQEYGNRDERVAGRRNAGPAVLAFSNCLPSDGEVVSAINLPWTPAFKETGIFALPADPAVTVRLESLALNPGLLKAAVFGTERDVWFLERMARSPHVVPLFGWFEDLGLPHGQGYQPGSLVASDGLINLPKISAMNLSSARLVGSMPLFTSKKIYRKKDPDIFRGPLVLLPEGTLATAPVRGRYTAAYDVRDLAYNESYIGISFYGKPESLALAFVALMHSALVAYQIAMTGGTVGIKQTKVEVVDLRNIQIPRIELLLDVELAALAHAGKVLSTSLDEHIITSTIETIDRIVNAAAGLPDSDCELISDVNRRARSIVFETPGDRWPMERKPSEAEIVGYALNVCHAFNAFAQEEDDLVLTPDQYVLLEGDLLAVRFVVIERSSAASPKLRHGSLDELGRNPFELLGGPGLPYLKLEKSLRLYVDRTVYVFKPARYRYFSPASGQSDGDRIVADLMQPTFPEQGSTVLS